jgi:hypothetical protein
VRATSVATSGARSAVFDTTRRACCQRSGSPPATATVATAVITANARSLRSGSSNESGSDSTASGSGRSRCSSQDRNSIPAPAPTDPITSASRASSDAANVAQAPSSVAAASQLRGLGEARPESVGDLGSCSARSGRTSRNAATVARGQAVHRPVKAVEAVEPDPAGRGKADREALDDVATVGRPFEVDEAVGQRSGELPPVGSLLGRVRGDDDPHRRGQLDVADRTFEHHAQHGRLDRRRRRRQLVEEQQAVPRLREPPGARRRREPDLPVDDHRQPAEVGRLANRPDHDLARPAALLGQREDGRCLTGARAPPQQHRHAGRSRHRESLTGRPVVHDPRQLPAPADAFGRLPAAVQRSLPLQ